MYRAKKMSKYMKKKCYYGGIVSATDVFVERLKDDDIVYYEQSDGKIHWTCSDPEEIFAEDFEEDREEEMEMILNGTV